MSKGITLRILVQLISAVGYLIIINITIAVGSIMVMFVAQVVFFFAVESSSMKTISYTVLAFPIISLILEIIVGRVKLSSLGMYDLIGFVLMAAGYIVFISKPLPAP